jgi:hypothetical protein
MRSMWRWHRDRRAFGAAVAVFVLVLIGLGSREVVDSVTAAPLAPPPAPAAPAAPTTTDVPRGLLPSPPVLVEIPKLKARSSLIPLRLNRDGSMEVPPVEHPMQAGWYSYGPTPGEVGPAVLVGHVDGREGAGIFYHLDRLVPGDEVVVTRRDGSRVTFRIRRVETVSKNAFPTKEVYGDTRGPELRLVTCGGSFDRHAESYRDNVIAYATME